MEPRFSMRAGGVKWLNPALLLITFGLLVGSIGATIAWPDEWFAIWLNAVLGFITLAFIYVILPQRYEIWPESLRLVFPLCKWDIPFDTIESARTTNWWEPYAFAGMRFATAPGQAIVVLRRNPNFFKRSHIVISPVDRAEFLRHLDRALGAAVPRA